MSSTAFGEHLKREREMRGVSLEEISAATRINTRFLIAIENERWSELPGGVFNRGFIRSIARFLGLDEDGLVAQYSLETGGNIETAVAVESPAEMPRHWRPAVAAIAMIVLVVVAGSIVYLRYGSRIAARLHKRPHAVSVVAPSATPTSPAATSGNPAPPDSPDELQPAAGGHH